MPTLLLRLEGPMQSWGTDSRFDYRFTEHEPSKSGVIGLLCAALGKPRAESPSCRPRLEQLAKLRMGVRVDDPGVVQEDYHTAGAMNGRDKTSHGVMRASGKVSPNSVVSHRYYLSGASFLVGLESEDVGLLELLDDALKHPHWQIYLGRKSFVPSTPVQLPETPPLGPGLRSRELVTELAEYRRPVSGQRLLLVIDSDSESATETRLDSPVDFARREFGLRHVRIEWV